MDEELRKSEERRSTARNVLNYIKEKVDMEKGTDAELELLLNEALFYTAVNVDDFKLFTNPSALASKRKKVVKT